MKGIILKKGGVVAFLQIFFLLKLIEVASPPSKFVRGIFCGGIV